MDGRKGRLGLPAYGGCATESVYDAVGYGDHLRYLRYSQIVGNPESANIEVAIVADRRDGFQMLTADQIRDQLATRNMTIRDLAEAIGMNENYLTKSLRGTRSFKPQELAAIAKEFAPSDMEPDGLRRIPLLGEVPAGKLTEAVQRSGRWIAVSDPETPRNAYALTVKGDSMDLIVPDGTTLIVDPDDKALWPGRRYVIQTEDGRTTFKEFQADPARLVPCSSNDEHQDIMLGAEAVIVLGRVFSYTIRDIPRRRA
jgi:SOS-response transcriptional repressor LexA